MGAGSLIAYYIYRLEDDRLIVLVVEIGPSGGVYKSLGRSRKIDVPRSPVSMGISGDSGMSMCLELT